MPPFESCNRSVSPYPVCHSARLMIDGRGWRPQPFWVRVDHGIHRLKQQFRTLTAEREWGPPSVYDSRCYVNAESESTADVS